MNKKVFNNAAWIIGCRIMQSGIGLIVTMLSARYLGPSGYGLINYAASMVALFVPVVQLGLNYTLIQEIIEAPEREGDTLGTAMTMSVAMAIICILVVCVFTAIIDGVASQTMWVCVLYALMLIFRGIEMIHYWFQAKLISKYTSIITLVAYAIVAVYRILLLANGCSIYWFAISQAIDFALIALAQLVLYCRLSGQKPRFIWERGKKMLARSWHYIIPGIMTTVFAQTDRVMLKMMLNEEAVGYYSAAVSCATLTAFVFVAIIDSARPTILEGKKKSEDAFRNGMKTLYAVIIILALLQSAVITALAKSVIKILYGEEYGPSITALQIIVWYTTFSYLGAVRDIWILAEKKQKYLWIINLFGAVVNVVLNGLLIPLYGVNGAAVASLVTQIFTNVIMGWIIRPISPSNYLMIQSLNLKFICSQIKKL